MKSGLRLLIILLAAFSLLFAVSGRAENNALKEFCVQTDYKFTPAELKSLELVQKAKEFEKKLGYKETANFKSFDKGANHILVMYQLKTEMPFSYDDYRFFQIEKKQSKGEAGERAWLAKNLGVTGKKHDIGIDHLEAMSGGTVISPVMLQAKPSWLAYLVFHEDWHDNVDLPIHFEEASGNLIGFAAGAIFLGSGNETLRKHLDGYSECARAINRCHEEISKLTVRLKNQKISYKRYLSERQRYISIAEKKQGWYSLKPIDIANHHTYTYYWPLVCRLYQALDCDIARFVKVLQEVSQHEEMREPPQLELSRKDYFLRSREAEKRIEVYLVNVIQKATADKEEKLLINEIMKKSFPEMTERIF